MKPRRNLFGVWLVQAHLHGGVQRNTAVLPGRVFALPGSRVGPMAQDDDCLYCPEIMDDCNELAHKKVPIRLRAQLEDVTEVWVSIGRDSEDGPEKKWIRIV